MNKIVALLLVLLALSLTIGCKKNEAAKPTTSADMIKIGFMGVLIMKEARKQGLKASMFGGDGLLSPEFIKLGGEAVEGTMAALEFSPEQISGEVATFITVFKKKFNGALPGLFVAQGYDDLMMLVVAGGRFVLKAKVPVTMD